MIFCRTEAEDYILWNRIYKIRTNSIKKNQQRILECAFNDFGIEIHKKNINLQILAEKEMNAYIHHELGHAIARDSRVCPLEVFNLAELGIGTSLEWFIYALHEILADMIPNGRLSYIIKNKDKGSFGFYVYDKISSYKIHPILKLEMDILSSDGNDLERLYWTFRDNEDWSLIKKFRKTVYETAKKISLELTEIEKIKDNTKKRELLIGIIKCYKST